MSHIYVDFYRVIEHSLELFFFLFFLPFLFYHKKHFLLHASQITILFTTTSQSEKPTVMSNGALNYCGICQSWRCFLGVLWDNCILYIVCMIFLVCCHHISLEHLSLSGKHKSLGYIRCKEAMPQLCDLAINVNGQQTFFINEVLLLVSFLLWN